MPFLHRENIAFHWEERGAGRPFLFQHGLGGDVSQPLGLFTPPEGVQLISMDCRGHGETRPTGDESQVSFRVFSDDLRALLEHLEIETAVVGGISMGAALALRLALDLPDQVAGLVLSRPAWNEGVNPFNVQAYSQIAAGIRALGVERARGEFMDSPFFQRVRDEAPDAADSLLKQFDSPRAEDGVARLERIPDDLPHPDKQAWAALEVPTLVLATEGDPIHPMAYARELASAIPGAQLHELPLKSQDPALHTALTQQHIEQFLEELSC